MGIFEDLFKWFIGLFVSDTTMKAIADTAEEFMNYLIMGVIPVKYVVLLFLGLCTIYVFSHIKYRKDKMLKTVVKSNDKVYGGFIYNYRESDDGKTYELSLDQSNVANIPVGTSEFGIRSQIIIDTAALTEFKEATEPYRVSNVEYKVLTAFGNLPYIRDIDTSKLEDLVSRWNAEFRSLSLDNLNQMSKEEKDKLSFKFTLLMVATDVLALRNDLTLLRGVPFYKKDLLFLTDEEFLVNEQDPEHEKDKFRKIQKELMTLNSVLVRSIVLREYFNADTANSLVKSSVLNTNNADEVLFASIPLYVSEQEKLVSITVLKPSLNITVDSNDVLYDVKKTVVKYKNGMKKQRIINNFIFRKKQ